GCYYHSTLVSRVSTLTPHGSLLVPAVVDASVGQSDHAARNPDVEHRRCGILQELPGRGAELIHAAHKPAPATEGLANGAEVRRPDGGEVGFHFVRVELVVLRAQRLVVQAH